MAFVSDHHFPRHTHDQFGVGQLLSGGHRSWSAFGAVTASAGDIIMVNPGEVHDGAPVSSSVREWRILYLDPAVVAREITEEFCGSAEIVRPVAADPLLAACISKLFECVSAGAVDALEHEERLLDSVIRLFRAHGSAPFVGARRSPPVQRALERIDSAPEKQVSLAELAQLCGGSRFQLLRAFSRDMGITPHAYVVQRRVLLARRFLAGGQTPAAAAIEAGFADQSHMSRAFLRQFGVTPGQYRAALAR